MGRNKDKRHLGLDRAKREHAKGVDIWKALGRAFAVVLEGHEEGVYLFFPNQGRAERNAIRDALTVENEKRAEGSGRRIIPAQGSPAENVQFRRVEDESVRFFGLLVRRDFLDVRIPDSSKPVIPRDRRLNNLQALNKQEAAYELYEAFEKRDWLEEKTNGKRKGNSR